MTVYDIKDEYFPKTIKYFSWTSLLQQSQVRRYHKSIIIESKMKNKNKMMVKFLLFGAFCENNFNNSFYEIGVDIDIDNDDNYKINIKCDTDANYWKIPQNIAEKYNYNSRFTYLSPHWYNSRYLIIVGGYLHNKASDKIICFDYK